jgi:integrase
MGVFRKKSKNYTGKYYISYSVNKKQYFESTGTHNRKEAESILALRKAAIFAQKWDTPLPAASTPGLKEWAEKFLKSVQTDSTRIRYQMSIKQLCRHWGDNTRISKITSRSIAEFIEKRQEHAGPAGINRDLSVLRRLLNLAVQQRLIGKSPFQQGQVSFLNERSTRKQPTIISFEGERRILEHSPAHLRACVALLVETGLRVNKEALRLKWSDIDWTENALTVRSSKTTAGRRSIPLSAFCFSELRRWRELVGESFSEYVFPNVSDPATPIKSIKRSWATAVKKAGMQPFAIYSLRAVFSSRLSAATVPDNFISQLLGHASGSLLRVYSKATTQFQRDAIRKLEELRKKHGVFD